MLDMGYTPNIEISWFDDEAPELAALAVQEIQTSRRTGELDAGAARGTLDFRVNVLMAKGAKVGLMDLPLDAGISSPITNAFPNLNQILYMESYLKWREHYTYLAPQHKSGKKIKRGYLFQASPDLDAPICLVESYVEVPGNFFHIAEQLREIQSFILNDMKSPAIDDKVYEPIVAKVGVALRAALKHVLRNEVKADPDELGSSALPADFRYTTHALDCLKRLTSREGGYTPMLTHLQILCSYIALRDAVADARMTVFAEWFNATSAPLNRLKQEAA